MLWNLTRKTLPLGGLITGMAVLGLLVLVWTALLGADGQSPVLDDPVPLQRIAIPLSRLPAELERVRQGVLVQMPRQEFEALVQRTAQAQDPTRGAARLIKAKYTAELVGNSLVRGSGQWTIHQPGATPVLLPLPSFNLALNKIHWAGGVAGILSKLDGVNLSLFVDRPGEVYFDWSLRGQPMAGGLQFDLQLPPCPVGVLELTVPADHQVLVPKNSVLLSGPSASDQAGKRTWHLQFSGKSQVEVQLRRPAEALKIAPLFLTQVQARQQVTPQRVTADFDFQVEILHTTVRELTFDCDPALQPFDVSLLHADLQDWEFKEAPPPQDVPGKKGPIQKPATLVVRLREPFQGILQGLKIRCLAPRPADKLWTSPTLQLRQAKVRGETLTIAIHPDVQMEAWDSAGFRLDSSTTDSDGAQVLTLTDPSGGSAMTRRPNCRFKTQGFELHARQQDCWQIGLNDALLTTEISYEMVRGNLFQLLVKLPLPGNLWQIETVEMEPKDTMRSWTTTGSLLMVDLQRGLKPRHPVKLSLRLAWRSEDKGSGPRTFVFPVMAPLDAAVFQGGMAVCVNHRYQSALEDVSVPLAPEPKEGSGRAFGSLPAQYYFEYRDQPVNGKLHLTARDAKRESAPERGQFQLGRTFQENQLPLQSTTNAQPVTETEREWCAQAHLTTYVESRDILLHHFDFQTWNWSKQEVMVKMPARTKKVLAAKVDGHWLEQLSQEQTAHGVQIKLPAAMDRGGHRFEIYYLTEAAWSGWPTRADVEASPPQLPVEPSSCRRTWRLAPGLMPLHQEHLQLLSEQADVDQDLRRFWHLGDPVLGEVLPMFGADSFEVQRQIVLGAESALRRKLTKDTTLGEALDRLAHDYLKEQMPLVLDRSALRALSIDPETTLTILASPAPGITSPFWESLGLVYVPFPSGPVLTTVQQLHAWQRIHGQITQTRQTHDAAVADAIASDHDALGRFVTLGYWLRTEKKSRLATKPLFLSTDEGWTVWEPRPGRPESVNMLVVQTTSLRTLGIILGLLWLVLAWRLQRLASRAWSFRFWVAWLLVWGLLMVWLPATLQNTLWWLLLASAFWLCGWLARVCLVTAPERQRARNSTIIARGLISGSTVWLLLMPGLWGPQGWSQSPEPYTVLLVESEPGNPLALVSQDLLKKLGEIEGKGALPAEAVPLAARYQGRMKGNLAEFTVQYDIHNFADKTRLFLALAGVDLQEGSTLDDTPVFPVAYSGRRSGYGVEVKGKGSHRLVLSFTVRPTPVGDFQEVRFACPRLCTNLVEWTMDGPAREMQVVRSLGAETVTEKTPNIFELKANLGAEPAVYLRWRLSNPSDQPTLLEVREGFLWNLRPGSAFLEAAWQFTPVKGSLSRLALALPDDFEVRSLEATSGNPGRAAGSASVLKNWQFTGKGSQRQLRVDLTGPTSNRVLLTANLIPRINLAAANVLLKFPAPLTGKPSESYLAYRLENLEGVDKTQNLGVASMDSEAFGKVWAGFGQKDPGVVNRAFSFRRTGGNAGLGLNLILPKPRAQADVTWTLFPQHADFAATIKLGSALEEFSLVEVNLPAEVTLAAVRGAAIHHWNRQKTGVQIWLEQPRKQAILELIGWAPLGQQVKGPEEVGRFTLPKIRIANIRLDSYQVKVLPSRGISAQIEKGRNLLKAKEPHTFTAQNQDYEGTFLVRRLPTQVDANILTTAEVRENSCLVVHHFHCQAPLGNPGPLRALLKNYAGAETWLELAEAPSRAGQRLANGDYYWDLTFPPGATQPFTFRIGARIPLKDLTKLALPEADIQGTPGIGRWLAVTGPDLRPINNKGLVKVADTVKELPRWPEVVEQFVNEGSIWRVRDAQGSLELEGRSLEDNMPLKILQSHEEVFLSGSRHWAHQSDFLLDARGAGELKLVLPGAALFLAMTLDDLPITPRPAGSGTYVLGLAAAPKPRNLRVHWQIDPEMEPLDRPNLGGLRMVGPAAAPLQGRLLVPPSFGVPEEWRKANEPTLENKKRDTLPVQSAKLPADTFPSSWLLSAQPEHGNPLYWQLPNSGPGVAIPLLDFTLRHRAMALRWTELLSLTALTLILLSYLPRGLIVLARLWPEMCLLSALVGLMVWGLSLVGFVLIALGVAGRLYWMVRWLSHAFMFQRQKDVP